MKKPCFLFEVIEAIPLPVFLVNSGLIDPSVFQRWTGAY